MTNTKSFREFNEDSHDEWQTLDEAGLSRVLTHLDGRNVGIITAFRGEYTYQENRARNRQLQADIRSAGFGFLRVEGHYPENEDTPEEREVEEESMLVIGTSGDDHGRLKGFLKSAGAKYGQDSVLMKPWDSSDALLFYTKSSEAPMNIGEFSLDPKKIQKMFSKFKRHKFVFARIAEQRGFFSRLASRKGYA